MSMALNGSRRLTAGLFGRVARPKNHIVKRSMSESVHSKARPTTFIDAPTNSEVIKRGEKQSFMADRSLLYRTSKESEVSISVACCVDIR